MTVLAVTRRPIVLEMQASGAMLTEMLARIEGVVGRASLYGVTDPVQAKLFASESIEADFTTGHYRNRFVTSETPATLPGWAFSRTGAGTAERLDGTVVSFATDVPRITDRGFLIEDARTNLLTFSQDFDNAAWSKLSGGAAPAPSVTANAASAPDGTTTADRVVLTLGGGATIDDFSLLYREIAHTAGTYARSVWLRSDTPCMVAFDDGNGNYPLVSLTSKWTRFKRVAANGATSTFFIGLRAGLAAGPTAAAATIDVWGGQLEKASSVSSYIPTTSASATRSGDLASLASAKRPKGLLFAEIMTPDTFTGPPGMIGASSVTPLSITASGASTFNGSDTVKTGPVASGEILKAALTWSETSRLLTFDGLTPLGDAASVGAWTTLSLGSNFGSRLNGYLRRILVLARDVPAAQLQDMTS